MQTDYVNFTIEKNIFEDIIQQYYQQGFSFIPVKYNSKEPLISWTEYQRRTPDLAEIYSWVLEFEIFNVGLITGFNGLYSLDIDDKEKIKELPEELLKTAITQTKRGYHLNFLSDKKLRTKKLKINEVEIEFKGIGAYVVEYPSIVDGIEYKVINPLSEIKRLPAWLEEKVEEQEQKQEQTQEKEQSKGKITRYKYTYTGKASCIKQILDRDLEIGEREQSLFILFNVLIREGNSKEHAERTIRKKNRSLKNPLTDKEIENIFKEKQYEKLGCKYIRGNLKYIQCEGCPYFKEEIKAMNLEKMLLDKNLDKKDVYILLKLWLEGKITKSELARELEIDRKTVDRRLEKLKNQGYLTLIYSLNSNMPHFKT